MIQICRQTRCRQNPASYNRARPHLSTAKYDNPAARVFNAMGPECVRKGRGASGAVCDLTFATSGIIRAQLSPRCHSERSGRSVTTGTQSKNPVEQPARIARKAAGFAPQSHKRLASSAFDCALRFQRTCFELELAPLGAATFLSPTEQTRGAPILWGVAPRRRATGKSPPSQESRCRTPYPRGLPQPPRLVLVPANNPAQRLLGLRMTPRENAPASTARRPRCVPWRRDGRRRFPGRAWRAHRGAVHR
ncbi:hypothetical protein CfE428DRAFT_3170 [Chthoniobacter flavus Ellin428]|uniref:Uncharacterized protein n=1 Tax=Chthoniobacter flavus Ellin428 TaxID=497964 RepID=B4D2P5_9BACT|nr:hypothetical protein CfE428DRAFT_3170 [Chthoniobacter flavus Ellin428]